LAPNPLPHPPLTHTIKFVLLFCHSFTVSADRQIGKFAIGLLVLIVLFPQNEVLYLLCREMSLTKNQAWGQHGYSPIPVGPGILVSVNITTGFIKDLRGRGY
jgi:hypothetical protein